MAQLPPNLSNQGIETESADGTRTPNAIAACGLPASGCCASPSEAAAAVPGPSAKPSLKCTAESQPYSSTAQTWDDTIRWTSERALKELLDSSIQVTRKGVTGIPWSADRVSVRLDVLGGRQVLLHSDNGVGMEQRASQEFAQRGHSIGHIPAEINPTGTSRFGHGSTDALASMASDVLYAAKTKTDAFIARIGQVMALHSDGKLWTERLRIPLPFLAMYQEKRDTWRARGISAKNELIIFALMHGSDNLNDLAKAINVLTSASYGSPFAHEGELALNRLLDYVVEDLPNTGTMFLLMLRDGPAGQHNKQLHQYDGELYFDPDHTRSLRQFYAEHYLIPPTPGPSPPTPQRDGEAGGPDGSVTALAQDIQRPGYFEWPDRSEYKLTVTVQGRDVDFSENPLLRFGREHPHSDVLTFPELASPETGNDSPVRAVITYLGDMHADRERESRYHGISLYWGCRRLNEPNLAPNCWGTGVAVAKLAAHEKLYKGSTCHFGNKPVEAMREFTGAEYNAEQRKALKRVWKTRAEAFVFMGVHVAVVLHPAFAKMAEDKMGVMWEPAVDAMLSALIRRCVEWMFAHPPRDVQSDRAAAQAHTGNRVMSGGPGTPGRSPARPAPSTLAGAESDPGSGNGSASADMEAGEQPGGGGRKRARAAPARLRDYHQSLEPLEQYQKWARIERHGVAGGQQGRHMEVGTLLRKLASAATLEESRAAAQALLEANPPQKLKQKLCIPDGAAAPFFGR